MNVKSNLKIIFIEMKMLGIGNDFANALYEIRRMQYVRYEKVLPMMSCVAHMLEGTFATSGPGTSRT